jgi:hypothetical protein
MEDRYLHGNSRGEERFPSETREPFENGQLGEEAEAANSNECGDPSGHRVLTRGGNGSAA